MEESGEQAAKNAKPASLRNTANSLLLAHWISSKHSKQNKSKIEDHSTKSPPPSSVELPMEGYYRNIGDVDCTTEIDCSSQHINKEIDCSSQHINKEIDCSSQDINEDFIKNILVEHTRRMHCRFQLYEDLEELSKIDESNIESFLTACKPHELNVLLLHASYSGRADLIRRLCEHKVNVNYAEPDQNLTALHLCAFRNCLDGVQHLITRDAKVHFREKHTPLYYAVLGDSYDVARYFVQQGISQESSQDKETLLHVAARRNAHRVLSLLVANNKELERLDSNGFAAIHHAAEAGNSNCLHVLLKAGCPVDLPTRKNDTALHLAAEASYVDNVFLLIEAKANLQLKNHQGHTALHLATRSQSLECVEVLLKVGADPNAEDDDGRSPLHLALSHQSLMTDDIVELLLNWKTNVNKADKCGYTPLHIAALKELSQCVNLLIRHDANLSAKTNRGITALSIILPKTPTYLDMFVRKLDAFVTLHRQKFVADELELRLDFSPLLQQQDSEIGYLNTLVKQGYKEILEHPLCQSFLHLKWQKIRKYYAMRLLFYLVYVLILTSWVIVGLAYNCYNETHGHPRNLPLCANQEGLIGIFYVYPGALENLWYILVIFTVLEVVRTLTVMPNYQTRQFFTENLMNWCVVLSVFVTSFVYTEKTYQWQRYFGAFPVLCGWINLMLMIGQLPMFGPYVVMFTSVQAEIFKLLLAYGCLLVGFTASFCVIFPHSKSFGNLNMALLKILAMMTGELNIDDLFWVDEKEDDTRFFPNEYGISRIVLQISAQLCFILFVLFVTIVLMNLLIGIAVHDIKGLQKAAGLIKLVHQTKLIYDIEDSLFFVFLLKRMICLRRSTLVHPSPLPVVLTVNPLNPKENRLPRDVLLAAYEKAKEGENRNNVAISRKKTYSPDSYEKALKGVTSTSCRRRVFDEETLMQNYNTLKDDISELRQFSEKILQELAELRDAIK